MVLLLFILITIRVFSWLNKHQHGHKILSRTSIQHKKQAILKDHEYSDLLSTLTYIWFDTAMYTHMRWIAQYDCKIYHLNIKF